MSQPFQRTLDSIQTYMEDAQQRTYSGPAGTRVLHTLVTMLAMHCLNEEQQRQVEAILDMHDACVSRSGEQKSLRGPS